MNYYHSEDWSFNSATEFPSITPSKLSTCIPTYSPSFITHDPAALVPNAPAFMTTTHELTFIASLLPSVAPHTSQSHVATDVPSDFELSKFLNY